MLFCRSSRFPRGCVAVFVLCSGLLWLTGCQTATSANAPGSEVAQMIQRAAAADSRGDRQTAERLYVQTLEIDPSNSHARERLVALTAQPDETIFVAEKDLVEEVGTAVQAGSPIINPASRVSRPTVGSQIAVDPVGSRRRGPLPSEKTSSPSQTTIATPESPQSPATEVVTRLIELEPDGGETSERADEFAQFVAASTQPADSTEKVDRPRRTNQSPLEKNSRTLATSASELPEAKASVSAWIDVDRMAATSSASAAAATVADVDRAWQDWQNGQEGTEVASRLARSLARAVIENDRSGEQSALAAIGQLRQEGLAAKAAVRSVLVESAKTTPRSIRPIRAAETLLKLDRNDRMARRALQVALKSGTDPQRVAAVSALAHGDRSSVTLLSSALDDRHEPVRAAAALALARHGSRAEFARDDLEAAATFDTPVVRQAARIALAQLDATDESVR